LIKLANETILVLTDTTASVTGRCQQKLKGAGTSQRSERCANGHQNSLKLFYRH